MAFYKHKETGAVVLAERQHNGEVLGVEANGLQFVGDFAAFETAFDIVGLTHDDLMVAGLSFPKDQVIKPEGMLVVVDAVALPTEEAPVDILAAPAKRRGSRQ